MDSSSVRAILAHKEDAYRVLGVEKNAPESHIKKRYRILALQLHPDKNQDPHAAAAFQIVLRAYETLKDPERRRIYDLGGYESVQRHDQPAPSFRLVLIAIGIWFSIRYQPRCGPQWRNRNAEPTDSESFEDVMRRKASPVTQRSLWLLTVLCVVLCAVLLVTSATVFRPTRQPTTQSASSVVNCTIYRPMELTTATVIADLPELDMMSLLAFHSSTNHESTTDGHVISCDLGLLTSEVERMCVQEASALRGLQSRLQHTHQTIVNHTARIETFQHQAHALPLVQRAEPRVSKWTSAFAPWELPSEVKGALGVPRLSTICRRALEAIARRSADS